VLAGGAYESRLEYCLVDGDAEDLCLRAAMCDAADRDVAPPLTLALELSDVGKFQTLRIPCQKPESPASVRLVIQLPAGTRLAVKRIDVRPDSLESVRALHAAEGAIAGRLPPARAAVPANYELLMQMARQLAKRGHLGKAHRFFAAAGTACPNRVDAVEGFIGSSKRIREDVSPAWAAQLAEYARTVSDRGVRPVNVRFENGARLTGFTLSKSKVAAGNSFRMRLFWDSEECDGRLDRTAVWIHFINTSGTTAFQEDYGWVVDLRVPAGFETLSTEAARTIEVPVQTRPGLYRITAGLWIPCQRHRLRAQESSVPVVKRGAVLGEIRVGN